MKTVQATIRLQDEKVGSLSVLCQCWNAHGDKAMVKAGIRVLGLFEGQIIITDEDKGRIRQR